MNLTFKEITNDIIDGVKKDYVSRELSEKQICKKYNISLKNFKAYRLAWNIPKRNHRFVNKNNRLKVNENYFEIIDSEHKAYWLGFITADASFNKSHKNSNKILTLAIQLKLTDLIHLEKFKSDLDAEVKIRTIKRLDTRTNNTYESCIIAISNYKICSDLEKHGVTINKSKELKLPNLSDDLMVHYLRGLIDGDGSWFIDRSNHQIGFNLVNPLKSFIEEVIMILSMKCDLNRNINITTQPGCFSFRYGGNIQCKKIYDYLYSNATIWLDRKQKLCEEWFREDMYKKPELKKEVRVKSELDLILGF